jgi:DNA (cytosine-5)-methyltransferase 1
VPVLRAVELFSGIGGFRLAADAAGAETVWANDSSGDACLVYADRFGSSALVEGDLRDHKGRVASHDLLTAGFPCQPFSSAGKKRGVRDPRGTLFAELAEIVAEHRPKFFVLENVKRLLSMEQGAHFATILDAFTALDYTVEWRLLNACDFGLPQNRQRIFLAGTRRDLSDDIPRLLSKADLATLSPEARASLDGRLIWAPLSSHRSRFPTWGLASGDAFVADNPRIFSRRVAPPPLHAVLLLEVDPVFDFTASTIERIAESVSVDSMRQGVEVLANQDGGARMGYTVYGTAGLAPTLTCTASRHYERYRIGAQYRRLTHIEYARIQGFPDDHCDAIPYGRQYVLYGNAVPPPMADWVLRRVLAPSGDAIDHAVADDTLQLAM